MDKNLTRRSFIEKSTLASLGTMFVLNGFSQSCVGVKPELTGLDINIFSKHLQFLNYTDMAHAAVEMGFDGIDLSVRPKGHVLPGRVKDDLPLAISAIKNVGFEPKMMTSGILSTDEPFSRDVLETAAQLGVKFYRLGYYRYPKDKSIPEAISNIANQVKELSILNKEFGIKGAYQNHAGKHVGAAIWEIHKMLKGVENKYMGCQYDIRHATVEGGQSWETGLRLIKPKINTIVLKDFLWVNKNGKWTVQNVPIGKGMVDFKSYFKLLKAYKINVPVSLHCEYDLGGAEHGKKDIAITQKEVFAAIKKDLVAIRELWKSS
ncbi:sugar phosphate isomerase/epimerase family protein [Seonamhaeicola maritimus]|uniref:sugar phosphate isomerase/epimerase family protein n=1 Tax=Seonamhaeicola maritimus TaxID=2591822 RepID=UPI00249414F3|nr:sugar phosphate isomerase/epimerase family protein [Seonamhaeicola maritimus]